MAMVFFVFGTLDARSASLHVSISAAMAYGVGRLLQARVVA
jgi:hypothetical protein